MVIKTINIKNFIEESNEKILQGEDLRPSLEISLFLIKEMADRLAKNSRNSSIPPASDKNRDKSKGNEKRKTKGKKRKPGGQPGHAGTTLKRTENPDKVVDLEIDRRTLPEGDYKSVGYDSAQVYDVEIRTVVTEYRAEILEDQDGNRYVADFPDGVTKSAQYGNTTKSLSVYMSNYQLIPLDRVRDFFNDQMGLPLSKGSVSNFNKEAHKKLMELGFIDWAKKKLLLSPVLHADESGVNVGGKGHWLHSVSDGMITLYGVDQKRGKEAMDRMGVLPEYEGVLIHDHWKPYYRYKCPHALCNAHHLRELEFAHEQDGQKWAEKMKKFLLKLRDKVELSEGGYLSSKEIDKSLLEYRKILEDGKKECPDPPSTEVKRGKKKKSKSRNLLERLLDYEEDVLRFIRDPFVPFTNNIAEGEVRVAKLYTNVSKCFRNLKGAKRFCDLRSWIITAMRHGIKPTEAIMCLFTGEIPFFMRE